MWDAGVVGAGEVTPAIWVGDAGRWRWNLDGAIQDSVQDAGVVRAG